MKKKLFLLNMFLSTSLISGAGFNVISCKKNVKPVEESKEKTEVVIKQKASLIKQKIKGIIDDYTTNSNNKDNKEWIVDLHKINYNVEKIKLLRTAVSNIQQSSNGKLVSEVDSVLNEIIKGKIKQISQYVTNKLKLDSKLVLSSDFQIEISDDFKPMLTNFTSIKFVEAIKKLLGANLKPNSSTKLSYSSKTYQNSENNELRDQAGEVDKLVKPDIFKINTNFSYTFSYAGIKENDEYKNVELLVTNDTHNTNYLKKYSNQQIQRIFNELTEEQALIYDGNVDNENISGQNYENLNTKFNWDFNDEKVQNEIVDIQVQKIKSMIHNNPVLNSFKFNQEEVNYEPTASMKIFQMKL